MNFCLSLPSLRRWSERLTSSVVGSRILAGEYSVSKKESFSSRIFCGKFSSTGKMFMAASQDGDIMLFDTSR